MLEQIYWRLDYEPASQDAYRGLSGPSDVHTLAVENRCRYHILSLSQRRQSLCQAYGVWTGSSDQGSHTEKLLMRLCTQSKSQEEWCCHIMKVWPGHGVRVECIKVGIWLWFSGGHARPSVHRLGRNAISYAIRPWGQWCLSILQRVSHADLWPNRCPWQDKLKKVIQCPYRFDALGSLRCAGVSNYIVNMWLRDGAVCTNHFCYRETRDDHVFPCISVMAATFRG